jgi:hypothetical protein
MPIGAYTVEGLTEEEQVASDPFRGRGLFLPMEARGDVILAELERVAGAIVPACAFDNHGVWVDTGSPRVDGGKLQKAWSDAGAH